MLKEFTQWADFLAIAKEDMQVNEVYLKKDGNEVDILIGGQINKVVNGTVLISTVVPNGSFMATEANLICIKVEIEEKEEPAK